MFRNSENSKAAVRFPRALACLAVLMTFAVMMTGAAYAQLAGTGAIAGTVQDPSGAVVGNATVTATNVNTNVVTTRTTTKSGDYTISPLAPGTYTLVVAAPGFQGYKQENVTVDALNTVAVNVNLTVGQASETVTVSTAPPLINTSDASLGAVMDNQMYSNLPVLMGAYANMDQRRVTDFAYLMPGVQSNYTNGNATSNSGITNGSGPSGGVQEIYIDGLNLPEADGVGDPRFTWTAIGVDAIDQFQVQTAGYSSQYSGQGVQNYSIKSGTNSYHGSLYEFNRNTIFDAWQFTSKVPALTGRPVPTGGSCSVTALSASTSWCNLNGLKPREIQNEFGIVLSGPIIKNKLFLFGNYGQYREQQGAKYAPITMPTAAMIGYTQSGTPLGYADFSGYAAANGGAHIYDPATQVPGCSTCTRQPFTAIVNGTPTVDMIPASRFSAASKYYNQFVLPYEPLINQNSYSNNLTFGTPIGLANWYETGKIDYDQSSRNQISLVVAFGRQAATGLNSGSGLKPPFNASQIYNPVTNVDMVKDTFTINSHLVNQFAIGYGRYQSDSVTPNRQNQYAASTAGIVLPAGLSGQAVDGFPGISWSGSFSNPPTWGGYAWNNKINNTYNLTDNLQWTFRKHNFTFGGQYVIQEFNYYKVVSQTGPMPFTFASTETANFSSGKTTISTTGSSVASYMIGAVDSSSNLSVNVPGLGTRWRDPSFWVEDDYKMNDRLTLNLGLRWDIYPSITEAHNIFSWLNPTGANTITGNQGTLAFAGSGSDPVYCNCSSPSQIYWKNIAPRFGFAYSVNPNTVVRGSFDVAYARGDWTSGSQSGSPSTLGFTPSASAPGGISAAPAFYWDKTACTIGQADSVACGWTGSVVAPAPPAGASSLAEYVTANTTALGKAGTSVTYFDPNYGARTPEYENWTLGLQRSLTKDMSITVSYVGSQGHFLSVSGARWDKNNRLPYSFAHMADFNLNGTTATPCGPTTCGFGTGNTDLLSTNSTAAAINAATAVGFTPLNPYKGGAVYYASNSNYQYFLPFPQFSGVSDTTSFVGNTAYHALQITLRQRNAHGLDFMLNYTYSKSIDDVGTFRQYDNNRLDRSISTTDQPHNLVGTVVYQLPFGKGKAFGGDNFLVNALAGGWNLSGVAFYHTGVPIVATASGCGGNSILGTCMPSLVSGVPVRQNQYGKNITSAPGSANYYANVRYLNPAAFSVNQAGTQAQVGSSVAGTTGIIHYVGNGSALYVPGSAPRVGAGNAWSMGYYDVDLSLKRTFKIHENWALQFEADMNNVTNHVVWGSINAGVAGSSFGQYNTSNAGGISVPVVSTPRDAQLAARLSF
ncbi:MAG TPA: carboxypeptidase-like regulatory domain-containing protein [Acidobacteriaceae bacterium]|nr:carboxypeptidase-like regulatory domain-containing protein [Acidobacteriaceae bacterium]